jgi:predicted RecB family endonuclease
LPTDPALAVAAMGASPASLRADLNTAGLVFESLCLRDSLIQAEARDGSVTYYRDEDGLEADAIIAQSDGTWGAVEVKLGYTQVDQAAAQLLRVAKKIEGGGGAPPAVLGVIVGVAGLAETRPDGIHVIPIDMLDP